MPYSSTFGIAARVIELPQQQIMATTLSRTISFSAAHAAPGVDPVPPDLRAHPDVVAGGGDRAGQRLDHTDLDRGLLGADGLEPGQGCQERNDGQRNKTHRASHSVLL